MLHRVILGNQISKYSLSWEMSNTGLDVSSNCSPNRKPFTHDGIVFKPQCDGKQNR